MDLADLNRHECQTESASPASSIKVEGFLVDYSLNVALSSTKKVTFLSPNRPSTAAPSKCDILIVLPNDPSAPLKALCGRLTEALMVDGAKVNTTDFLAPVSMYHQKLCIVLLESDEPLLYNWIGDEFDAFRNMIHEAKGCLWITRG